MVEVGAGGGQRRDDAVLDEGNEAALVQPRRRHRARKGEENGAVLLDGALHQFERGSLLPAHVGAKGVLEQLVRLLATRDGLWVDTTRLLVRVSNRFFRGLRGAFGHRS